MPNILAGTLDARDPTPSASASSAAQVDCVVLCGGLGTRLAQALPGVPKCLAEVTGRPFIEWILLGLRSQGVTDVLLATGHLGDQVEARLADGGHLGLRLRYSAEPAPLGTAGALRHAVAALRHDAILVVNGDTYSQVDLAMLSAVHQHRGARLTVLTSRVADRSRYGSLEIGADGRVTAFGEKKVSGPGVVSCGVYLIERAVVEQLPEGRHLDLESAVLPALVGRGLYAAAGDGTFIDIGTPESLAAADEVVANHVLPALAVSRGNAAGHVRAHLDATALAMRQVAARCSAAIVAAAELVAETFTAGGKVLLCGNGGSAADCQHVAAEFVSRLDRHVDRAALPAIALTTDSSFLTAYANDVDFDGVFARQVEALGRPGDVLVAISTSGSSRNVRRAIEAARRRHMRVIGLFGDGAPLAGAVDVPIVVPTRSTQTTQECMLAIEHSICEVVEQVMYGSDDAMADAERAVS